MLSFCEDTFLGMNMKEVSNTLTKNTFVNAVKWSLLAEAIPKVISPLVVVVLARLLTPADYGVVAAAVIVISFCRVFWEAGMGKALIQRKADIEVAADVAFWVNIGLSLLVSSLLFVLAHAIALYFFHDLRVATVIKVLTLQVIFGALSSVPTALLQRELKYKRLFWVQFTTVAVPAFFSIPLAWKGLGYWALVVGTVAGQAGQVLVLWKATAWRPSFRFSDDTAREIVPFGAWVATDGLLGWFYVWADSLIVGFFFGASTLGFYRLGNTLVLTVFGILINSSTPVIYSALSQTFKDGKMEDLRAVLLKAQAALFALALPAGVGFLLFGDLIPHFIGKQWIGIGTVISILGMKESLTWLTGINSDGYKAAGRPDLYTKILAFALIYHIPTYYVFARYGLKSFLWARITLTLLTEMIHFYMQDRFFKINVKSALKNIQPILLSSFVYIMLYKLLSLIVISSFYIIDDIIKVVCFVLLVGVSYFFIARNNPVVSNGIMYLSSLDKKINRAS